jgi:hypothetical protein
MKGRGGHQPIHGEGAGGQSMARAGGHQPIHGERVGGQSMARAEGSGWARGRRGSGEGEGAGGLMARGRCCYCQCRAVGREARWGREATEEMGVPRLGARGEPRSG